MKKRLIFDLDNTLIDWKIEYFDSMKRALKRINYNYDEQFFEKLIESNNSYEYEYSTYNKQDMLDSIYRYTGVHMEEEFIDIWQEELGICADVASDSLKDTLKYLSSKYELVVLSNWFGSAQTKRLESAGIRKYFIDFYYPEDFTSKPAKEAFLRAIGPHDVSDCIMIGDSIRCDLEGANAVGMDAIYYNRDGIKYKDYILVRDLSELKGIL